MKQRLKSLGKPVRIVMNKILTALVLFVMMTLNTSASDLEYRICLDADFKEQKILRQDIETLMVNRYEGKTLTVGRHVKIKMIIFHVIEGDGSNPFHEVCFMQGEWN